MAQPTNQEKIGLLQSVFDLPEDEILTIVKNSKYRIYQIFKYLNDIGCFILEDEEKDGSIGIMMLSETGEEYLKMERIVEQNYDADI